MVNAQEDKLITRNFVLLFGAHFVQAFGYSSLLLFPVYLDHLGASRAEIGSIMAVAAIGSLSLRPVVAWALDSVGRKPVLIAGTIVLVLAMLLIGFVDHAGGMAYASRFLFGIAAGALFPGYFALAADIVPEGRRTEGLAVFGLEASYHSPSTGSSNILELNPLSSVFSSPWSVSSSFFLSSCSPPSRRGGMKRNEKEDLSGRS